MFAVITVALARYIMLTMTRVVVFSANEKSKKKHQNKAMKLKTMTSKIALWLLPVALLAGCTTATPSVSTVEKPVVTQQPQTNVFQTVNPANGVVTVVTNVVQVPVTNYVPVVVTNTVYSVDTNRLQQIVSTAQTVGSVAGVYYPPAGAAISTIAGIGGTLLFGISTAIAAYKNQQKKNILQAVIAGIEGAPPTGGNDATPISTAAVKQSIQTQAINAGVQPALNALVKTNT